MNTFFSFPVVLQPALTSAGRLREIFGLDTEYEQGALLIPGSVEGRITLSDVTFGYTDGAPVLRNVSLTIHPGDVVAVVGRTGAGKTTLVHLLLKAFVPQSGTITLDSTDISLIDSRWLRRQISIVSQDLFLFHTTIEDNIRYSRPEATRDEVIEAARKARIHDDIVRFPEGYETVVGERGTRLSVGQRQRIAIARAFLKDAPILILDEPTSALDRETERELQETLRTLVRRRTTIIISHRLSLLSIADRVLSIENGLVREVKPGCVHSGDAIGGSAPDRGIPAGAYNL